MPRRTRQGSGKRPNRKLRESRSPQTRDLGPTLFPLDPPVAGLALPSGPVQGTGQRVRIPVLAAAALFTAGVGCGLPPLTASWAAHFGGIRAIVPASAALASGVWIHRRRKRRPSAAANSERAATLAATWLLGFAGTALLLAAATSSHDGYRDLLAHRFLHPAWLTGLLAGIPSFVALLLAALAFDGTRQAFSRCLATSKGHLGILVVVGLVAATISATVAPPRAATFAALISLFAAGACAALPAGRPRSQTGAAPLR